MRRTKLLHNSPEYDEFAVEEAAQKSFQKFLDELDAKQRAMLRRTTNFYVASFRNLGGLVMPIIVRVHYGDNTNELVRIPAEIWRSNSQRVDKLFVTDKEIVRFELDPQRETADTEQSNNHWPPKLVPSRFKLFKDKKPKNPMQKARNGAKEKKADEDKEPKTENDLKEP